ERHRTEVERKAFTEKMQQIQKLESLGVLAGGIAHDFNNLLTVIMGNNEMAGDLIAPGHPAHPFLRELEKATLRAAGLTNQMLAYSGKGAFTLTPVDLNALTREMATLLHASISKKAVLKFEFEEALPAIEGDPSQLSQVILNLITNASEAIEPGTGTITLRTGLMSVDEPFLSNTALPDPLPTGRYLFLEVSDTGTGMNEETRARIFEPFFTTKFTGRGLGLSATLGIIRGHKGSIRVWSEPGKGTRFTLIFPPCGEREKGDKTGPVSARPPEANATVLVVDDEDLVRGVVRRLLQQEGFNTLEACNGQEAIETVAREGAGLDAIVLDLMMPVMGGEEAFQEIRRLHPGLPILVVSGFAGNALAARFETKAATVFLQKPFTGNDLTEALSRAMEGRIPRS
ncbi:MAG: response regulator, partial [Verrucomicrobiota bacterium]